MDVGGAGSLMDSRLEEMKAALKKLHLDHERFGRNC